MGGRRRQMLLSAKMGCEAWDILKYKMAAKIAAPEASTWCSAVLSDRA
jgi:hypothetical protein